MAFTRDDRRRFRSVQPVGVIVAPTGAARIAPCKRPITFQGDHDVGLSPIFSSRHRRILSFDEEFLVIFLCIRIRIWRSHRSDRES